MTHYGEPHILERRFFAQDRVIMNEGETADFAYIIQSGAVEIYREKNGVAVSLAKLKVGEIFGETALLFDGVRSASARAVQDTVLVVITRSVLEQKLKDSDVTIAAIVRMMKNRLNEANTARVDLSAVSIEDIHKTFGDTMGVILRHIDPELRDEYRTKASPALKEFLDLTQDYLNKSGVEKI